MSGQGGIRGGHSRGGFSNRGRSPRGGSQWQAGHNVGANLDGDNNQDNFADEEFTFVYNTSKPAQTYPSNASALWHNFLQHKKPNSIDPAKKVIDESYNEIGSNIKVKTVKADSNTHLRSVLSAKCAVEALEQGPIGHMRHRNYAVKIYSAISVRYACPNADNEPQSLWGGSGNVNERHEELLM